MWFVSCCVALVLFCYSLPTFLCKTSAYSVSSYNLTSVFNPTVWSRGLIPKLSLPPSQRKIKNQKVHPAKILMRCWMAWSTRRDKKGETEASKILEVGSHKNKSIIFILPDQTPFKWFNWQSAPARPQRGCRREAVCVRGHVQQHGEGKNPGSVFSQMTKTSKV